MPANSMLSYQPHATSANHVLLLMLFIALLFLLLVLHRVVPSEVTPVGL
jgi:hypothetical protein